MEGRVGGGGVIKRLLTSCLLCRRAQRVTVMSDHVRPKPFQLIYQQAE